MNVSSRHRGIERRKRTPCSEDSEGQSQHRDQAELPGHMLLMAEARQDGIILIHVSALHLSNTCLHGGGLRDGLVDNLAIHCG